MELGCSWVSKCLPSSGSEVETLQGAEGMLTKAAKGSPQPKLLAQFLGQNVTQVGGHEGLHLLELRTAKSESLRC